MSQALFPFNQAVYTALEADVLLTAYTGGVAQIHSGVLAQDIAADDFVILGSDDSAPWLRFNGLAAGQPREGEQLGLMLDGWSRIRRTDGAAVLGKDRILTLAGHVARILNQQVLTLPSYGFVVAGRVETLFTRRDPGLTLMHVGMRYDAIVTRQPGDLP